MKTIVTTIGVLLLMVSCGGNTAKNKIESVDAQSVAVGKGQKLVVDTTSSLIEWQGSKSIGGGHDGYIYLKEGNLTIEGDSLVAGHFVINMKSIKDNDLTTEMMNTKLVGHLESADFFDVAKYPEAIFSITKAMSVKNNDSINYMISGNLKMKEIDKNITFGAKITKEGDTYKAVTIPFTIDRTQWGIVYSSESVLGKLKDGAINDDITLKLKINAKIAN